jgi:DNA-directed RNA polymerase subunit beta'
VLYFESYIVTEPGLTPLKEAAADTKTSTSRAGRVWRGRFTAGIGAEAIREMLMALDLEGKKPTLREELAEDQVELKPKKIAKRLKLVESFIESGNRRNG